MGCEDLVDLPERVCKNIIRKKKEGPKGPHKICL